jgi:serine protease AprX
MGISTKLFAALLAVFGFFSPPAGVPAESKLDPSVLTGPSPRAIVMFDHDIDASTIRRLARAGIAKASVFESIDAVGVLGPRGVYEEIATWTDVLRVDDDSRIVFDNYRAKRDTRVTTVRAGRAALHRPYTGKGVTVAEIDTGITDLHPDLDGQVIRHMNFEPAWVFDEIQDGVYSNDIAKRTATPLDTIGHGTHVAGIIAGTGAAGADSGYDYSGVAPGAKIVDLKIADAWQTQFADIGWEVNALAAYEWVIEHRNSRSFPGGIRVVSNSWSVYEVDTRYEPITLIVQAAARAGLISVFAAGNDGPDPNTVALGPNRLREVITVAASCKSVDSCGAGKIASFSSRGPQVDIAAPGDNVFSTAALASPEGHVGDPFTPGGPQYAPFYIGFSGTSMATPHVAGIVALMLEANPRLTRVNVQQILHRTAIDHGTPGFDNAWGHGMADAFAAVARADALAHGG